MDSPHRKHEDLCHHAPQLLNGIQRRLQAQSRRQPLLARKSALQSGQHLTLMQGHRAPVSPGTKRVLLLPLIRTAGTVSRHTVPIQITKM